MSFKVTIGPQILKHIYNVLYFHTSSASLFLSKIIILKDLFLRILKTWVHCCPVGRPEEYGTLG